MHRIFFSFFTLPPGLPCGLLLFGFSGWPKNEVADDASRRRGIRRTGQRARRSAVRRCGSTSAIRADEACTPSTMVFLHSLGVDLRGVRLLVVGQQNGQGEQMLGRQSRVVDLQ